jgi:hypothetical protein
MRLRAGRFATVLMCGTVLSVGASGTSGADPASPSSLLPALDVYIDAVVAGHAAAACAGPKSPVANKANWEKAKAIFVATLWANDFPIVFVRTAQKSLDAPLPKAPPDCSNPALDGELGSASQEGWVAALETPLKGMDLTIITQPVDPAVWSRIKNLIVEDSAAEKRLLDCVAVTEPDELPGLVDDWDQMIGRIGQNFVAVGLPRDEVSSALSAADANTLWHRAAPDAEAELRDSCQKDKSWQTRLDHMTFLTLGPAVDKLLPPAPPPASGND